MRDPDSWLRAYFGLCYTGPPVTVKVSGPAFVCGAALLSLPPPPPKRPIVLAAGADFLWTAWPA